MSNREAELFEIGADEVRAMFSARIDSIRKGIDQVKEAIKTEEIRRVKEDIFPGTLRLLEIELKAAIFLRDHVAGGPFHLAADQLDGLRLRLEPLELDLAKIRLVVNRPEENLNQRRALVTPGNNPLGELARRQH